MIRYRVATNAGSTVKRCEGIANQIAVTPATLASGTAGTSVTGIDSLSMPILLL